MKRIVILCVFALALTACGSATRQAVAPTLTEATPTVAPSMAKPARLRIEVPATPDIGDIPRLIAFDAMKSQGYQVEPISLADTNSTILAMEKGDLDLANLTNTTAWTAIQKGAPLVMVIDDSANSNILAVGNQIKQCSDLNGKRVGTPSLTSSNAVMLSRYIETHCPGTKPEYLIISGKDNRIAGLLAGKIDASLQDQADLRNLENQSPGNFRAFPVFAQEFPGLTTLSQFARRELIDKYPFALKDWLRALLDARRRIQDPKVLAGEFVKRLDMDPAVAQTTAITYLGLKFWDVNGRYTPEIIQQNIDFYAGTGSIKETLNAKDVSDLSFLNAVLDEIGRK